MKACKQWCCKSTLECSFCLWLTRTVLYMLLLRWFLTCGLRMLLTKNEKFQHFCIGLTLTPNLDRIFISVNIKISSLTNHKRIFESERESQIGESVEKWAAKSIASSFWGKALWKLGEGGRARGVIQMGSFKYGVCVGAVQRWVEHKLGISQHPSHRFEWESSRVNVLGLVTQTSLNSYET